MAATSRSVFSTPLASRRVFLAAASAIALGGTLYTIRNQLIKPAFAEEQAPRKSTFGSIGFRSLKVEKIEEINHDTRRVRFALPEGEVSGLKLTSALLSMSWPTGRWTPVFRPYTPVSDLGKAQLSAFQLENGRLIQSRRRPRSRRSYGQTLSERQAVHAHPLPAAWRLLDVFWLSATRV